MTSRAPILAAGGVLRAADGHVVGRVTMRQVGDKVSMLVKVWGLAAGAHGLQFHDKGACAGPSFRSAGGQFRPLRTRHGGPGERVLHAGDLGNLTVDKNGSGDLTIITDRITLHKGGRRSVSGRSVLIHGAADEPVACAVITSSA